jgi:hypothetical protein
LKFFMLGRFRQLVLVEYHGGLRYGGCGSVEEIRVPAKHTFELLIQLSR